MTAAEVAAAAAPVWNLWTVMGTAGAGAAVALLVDFFLKPRLQVRNEKFSQQAKDRLEIVRVVRGIMVETRKGIPPGSFDHFPPEARPAMQKIADDFNGGQLEKLNSMSEELQAAYILAGHHLPASVLRLVEKAGGTLHGGLLAGSDMTTMAREMAPLFNFLYDVLMTSRFQVFAYGPRHAWVRRYLEAEGSARQLAVLRAYGLGSLGKSGG